MALGISVLVLTGCFFRSSVEERCARPQEYQASEVASGIVVPDGLAAPAPGQAYQLPADARQELPPEAGCLDRPPNFFRQDPAAAPAGTPAPTPAPAPTTTPPAAPPG